jgi:hypothetical protein
MAADRPTASIVQDDAGTRINSGALLTREIALWFSDVLAVRVAGLAPAL